MSAVPATVTRVTSHTWVEPEQWYRQLPSFYAVAAALITDPAGLVLLVKPSYRDHWVFPGGWVDAGESPDQACARELREELDLALPVGSLLVVDWASPAGRRPRAIVSMTFDCGTLAEPTRVRLAEDELCEWAFLPEAEAARRLPPSTAPRLPAALRARGDHSTVYLRDGQPASAQNVQASGSVPRVEGHRP